MTLFSSQPDASGGIDTKISSSVTTRNFGIATTILGGTNEKLLIYFDLSSIPAGATCDDATLSLYQAGSAAANAFTLTAYAIASGNSGWVEGTKNNATAGTGEPCWDYKAYNTVNWAGSAGLGTSGTDYDATALGTDAGNRSDANGTEYPISLDTTAMEAMFGNSANYGFLVVTSTGCGAIAASDHATAAYRPKLVINYTEAGGAIAGTSAGAATVSGTLVGAGALAGASAGAGAGTATLAGSGALAGASAGLGDATATLAGAGALAGASAGVGDATATLGGVGALAGSASGTSTASGTLEQPAGDGAIAGTSAGAATATGTLSGAGALVGNAAGLGGASGTLAGVGALAGTSAGVGDATATLTGSGSLAGASAGAATASGLLLGTGALSGAAAGAALTAAILVGFGALAGSAAGTSTASLFAGHPVTPANRIYIPGAEDRTLTVESESRALVVGSEDRTLAAESESRAFVVATEDRTYEAI